jgi:IS5 family transposase
MTHRLDGLEEQIYVHAYQFKRANRNLRKLKTCLGRVIRDIRRKTAGQDELRETFVRPLFLTECVLPQHGR